MDDGAGAWSWLEAQDMARAAARQQPGTRSHGRLLLTGATLVSAVDRFSRKERSAFGFGAL
ncbi:hypothetical protein [Desulfoglaeba alkanexedens]|uniref:Uncharacterized protein n=1 Tax=Desulfoglaeba alkanexedens ALDC TaxID=980445 RepID=A0A4P8L633_9BACT|nr:hypothetical protein [Desulfoglaeba alkanexedens]QCQ22555.1 hypothetical protein FDQ92_10500 [Desulfoglaeba alkanexedens ALDC]